MGSDADYENKRYKKRVKVGISAELTHADERGSGLVTDVSNGGALIEQSTLTVEPGGVVEMQLRLGGSRIHVSGRVVRTLPESFAIQFESGDTRLEELLEIALSRLGPESDEIED